MKEIDFFNTVAGFFPWGFTKLAIIILIMFYIVFAAIIVRQEQLMSRIVEIPYSPTLRLISLIHLVASIGVFFLAFILI